MGNNVALTLNWFQKNGGHLVGDETICVDLEFAIELIGIKKEEDPFIAYKYEVKKKLAKKIQYLYEHQIDINAYNYYINSYSDYECVNGRLLENGEPVDAHGNLLNPPPPGFVTVKPLVGFPFVRKQTMEFLQTLSNKDLHLKEWKNSKVRYSVWKKIHEYSAYLSTYHDISGLTKEELTMESEDFYSDGFDIGYCLFNQEEIDIMMNLIRSFKNIFLFIGERKTDSVYLNSPLWNDLVGSAKQIYDLMEANNEKYGFDKIYQEYLEKYLKKQNGQT